ncbi:Holliday junction branch migration protein RuvA [Enterovirga sp.]|uniref:Holliday junction branch migration protein RuvA n=1 Tax=Enterovirga sp. TaxID=2026350 RepID=UPI002CBDE45E|nr:Holliday junction branch migration protein RuvA [Enterovirga sp.]HMO29299.1 Holliday junction branch migration protein RuvA [Enterovirga sp.]
MIGKLRGVIDSQGEDFVIVDVGGVGYVVHCSSRTLQNLPAQGEAASLSIETHVREDMIRLYGFRSDQEREWFRLLQGVQGVGAKVALAILSVLEPGALAAAIATGDRTAIARAPGVGPKLAARIAAEMKDKAPAFGDAGPVAAFLPGAIEDRSAPPAVADAVSALVNLGYGQSQAAAAIAAALRSAPEGAGAPALIRLGLRELAKG